MRRICLAILIMLIGVFGLISCDNSNEEIPEGLQLVEENNTLGYKFYGPEGWVIANRGGISASYVTAVNNTSITFAKADAPVGTVSEYFDNSMAKLPYDITISKRDEACSFGNADEAYKYIYTYKYQDYDFACMQILVKNDADFYIFTYNSYGDVNDENSDYRQYLETVQLAVDSFKFTDITENAAEPTYEKDEDGYNLVSDEAIAGFALYLPDGYEVVDNGSIVSARINDRANISLSKASGTGVSIADYWNNRKTELSAIVSDLEVISENVINDGEHTVVLGDLAANRVASYEYTYVFNGTTYHVYQVLGVDSFNGYVFTYTATEDEYAVHIDEIKTILEKVKF